MSKTPNERLASIETKLEFLKEIKEFMEDGREMRIENALNIASIRASILDFTEYQKECDSERKIHGDRLDAMEGDIKVSKKIAGGIGAIVAFAITTGVELLRRQ